MDQAQHEALEQYTAAMFTTIDARFKLDTTQALIVELRQQERVLMCNVIVAQNEQDKAYSELKRIRYQQNREWQS